MPADGNVNPMAKSAVQKGQRAVETMMAPPGSSMAAGSGSWQVNAMGELVQAPNAPQQTPIAPQHGDNYRWKSKWNKETGTASVIGHPVPPRPSTAQSSAAPAMAPVPEFMVQGDGSMEVGNVKRGLETDGLMHEEEADQWDLIHDEILHQLTTENLVGTPHQQGEPVPDGS